MRKRKVIDTATPVVKQKPLLEIRSILTLYIGLAFFLSACNTLAPSDLPLATAAACGTVNVAQGKPAKASTTENSDFLGAKAAFDGDMSTRWASEPTDSQWLQVALGSTQTVCQVVLEWEGSAAYGKAFKLEASEDGVNWTPIYTETEGKGGSQTLEVSGAGQYVRMNGAARGTGYGYSLLEFKVFTAGSGTVTPPTPPTGSVGPGVTKITGTQGNWQLSVDSKPYVVKGLTWGPPVSEAAQRMPDLQQMGVNTIRTWATDASSRPLFDAAADNGLKVVAGFWLAPGGGPGSGGCPNYVTDAQYKADSLSDIKTWVTEYRNHPGVLMWNIGNESILGLQNCYSGTELEDQRNAYATFINEAAKAVHTIDANHPVTNTDAWTGAWKYLKANAPELDLYAVNAYKQGCNVKGDWEAGGYTKPYILTEGGPAGEWEVPDDENGVPTEPTDVEKAEGYTRAWDCVTGHTGVALGATLFHYGTEGNFGGVWFNLIPNGEKRLSYYAVRKMYGGVAATNTPPVITNMTLSNSTAVSAGGTFTLSADVSDPDGDAVSYTVGYNSKYINNADGIISADFSGNAGSWTVTAPKRLGVWKVYLYARDGDGNIGIETRSLRVVAPQIQGANIALNKLTTASSFQPEYNAQTFFPRYATDGNLATRWSSAWSDDQWLEVDLGSVTTFNYVQLVWETAYAKAYKLQVSGDGTTWSDLYTTTTGDGNTDGVDVGDASGRYVRMTGTQRGTEFGYALYEFGVYRR